MLRRRSMGLPPSQGHNNLRLYHTTNIHHNHQHHRLNTNTHFNTKSQHFKQPAFYYCDALSNCNHIMSMPNIAAKQKRPTSLLNSSCLTIRDRLHNKKNISISQYFNYHPKSHIYNNPRYASNLSMISNMPLINMDYSMVVVNDSPFALRDSRFGILHHCSQSISYI